MKQNIMSIRGKPPADGAAPARPPIGREELQRFTWTLEKYSAGLKRTKSRIIASENWWKLRNGTEEQKRTALGRPGEFSSASGWLHNVVTSKHADAMDAYPRPCILPREEGDRAEAEVLSAIIPAILEQNRYERVYSDAMWAKVKYGTAVYKVVWDSAAQGGLGDIRIENVNLLDLYWEPGVTDIQRSRYFFHTELTARDTLAERYPQCADALRRSDFAGARFLYDDTVDTANMVTVVDVYYHKMGKLHYCKYVGDQVLYATENDYGNPEGAGLARAGLYGHGLYPYVFDALFPIEGSPCGYGYVDLCKNPQTEIDLLKTAFLKNAMVSATPRFLERQEGAVNEREFLDLTRPIVHVSGATLGEDSLRQIETRPLDDVNVAILDRTIQELRETSGNTETGTGNVSGGVTAASAIAALQEASGKGSRDSTMASYRAYGDVIGLVIELIRQFYDLPRQFRIVGAGGAEVFVTYTNARLRPQAAGMGLGLRAPAFDIRVSAERQSAYTRASQNELAIRFFQLGFFKPELCEQALAALELMDFPGKDELVRRLRRQSGSRERMLEYMRLALMLARRYAPELVTGLSRDILSSTGGQMPKLVENGRSASMLPAGTSRADGKVKEQTDEKVRING